MARNVFGLFDSISDAQDTVRSLVDAGFSRDRVSYISSTAGTQEDMEHAQAGGAAEKAVPNQHDHEARIAQHLPGTLTTGFRRTSDVFALTCRRRRMTSQEYRSGP
jgi:hypothetical protein